MNQLNIIGNVTRDPELRTTQTGKKVCTFKVAVNNSRRKTDEAQFFRCTAWERLAETCAQYLTKGKKVAVTGNVSMSEFTAKNDGAQHATLEVNVSDVEFLSGRSEQQGSAEAAPKGGYEEVDGDDLPF